MASLSASDAFGAFHDGPGTSSLDDAASAGQDLLSRYNDRMTQVSGLVQGISGSWTGSASDAAQAGAQPLVRSLQQSHDALTTTQNLMTRQSGSFHDAARSVQQMPDQPPQPTIGDFLPPWSSSYEDKANAYIGQARANVTAMQNYGVATGYNHGVTPTSYGGVTGGGSDVTIAPDQGPGDPGGTQQGPGGGSVSHTPGGYSGGGPGAGAHYVNSPGGGQPTGTSGQPGGSGYSGPGSSTNQQGWQGGAPGQVPGYGAPGYGQPGDGSSFGPGSVGGFGPVGGFGAGADGGVGGGSGRGGVGGGVGARGFGAGAQGGSQPGAGNRTGVGGVAGEGGGPGAAAAAGRAGAPGVAGSPGMAGGQRGKKEEDQEHKTAAYLEDDYSDEIVGQLPTTVPPVIGLN
jgi:PPE family